MTVVLAFDSFKGCISAQEACHAAARGIHQVYPDASCIIIPLSDGGEGLVSCVQQILPTKAVSFHAHGPLMEEIEATYALSEDGLTAYMEMAATSGLPLVPQPLRNPMHTTTYGVGEMLLDAAKRGCRKVIMGIGGSATCDGGRGMMQALRDAKTDTSALPYIVVASDVTNPLYGPNGAAYVYAPQKGATPKQVKLLDEQLRAQALQAEQNGVDTAIKDAPGAGAAGGLGYGLMAYLGAELRSGIDIVLDITRFSEQIQDADLVITGEGKSDVQTLMGKVPDGVLGRCRKADVPVWLLSGAIDDADHSLENNFNLVTSINRNDHRPLSVLMQPEVAKSNMSSTVEQLLKIH